MLHLFLFCILLSGCTKKYHVFDKPVFFKTNPNDAEIFVSDNPKKDFILFGKTNHLIDSVISIKDKYFLFRKEGYITSSVVEFPGKCLITDSCYLIEVTLEKMGNDSINRSIESNFPHNYKFWATLKIETEPSEANIFMGQNPNNLVIVDSNKISQSPVLFSIKRLEKLNYKYFQVKRWGYEDSDILSFPINAEIDGNYILRIKLREINNLSDQASYETKTKLTYFGIGITFLIGITILILLIVYVFKPMLEWVIYYYKPWNIRERKEMRRKEYIKRTNLKIDEYVGKNEIEPLIKKLKDKYEEVSLEAAKALGNIGDIKAVKPLIKSLENANRNAPEALVKLGDSRAVDALIEALEDKRLENEAVKALGNIGDIKAVKPLIKLLKNGNYHAPEALVKLGDPSAVDPLISALQDGRCWYDAARALGKFGDIKAVEPLIKALYNENVNAAEALGEIGDSRAIDSLIISLGKKNSGLRETAAKALQKILIKSPNLNTKNMTERINQAKYSEYSAYSESTSEHGSCHDAWRGGR